MEDSNTDKADSGLSVSVEDKQTQDRPAEVEGAGSRPDESVKDEGRKGPDPFQAQKRITEKQNKEIKELKDMFSKFMESQAKAQTPSTTTEPSASDALSQLLADPDSWVEKKLSARTGQIQYEIAKKEAEQYVLSQEYIDPANDMEYLEKLMAEHGINEIRDPYKQAQTLLKLVRLDRGIGAKSAEKAKVQVPQGTRTPVAAGIFNEKSVKDMSMEDYEKHRVQLLSAAKEGKINK